MIRAIFWDNDGVLVDTERLFFEATREEFAGAGVELTLERYQELSLRQGRSCFEDARRAGLSERRIEALRLARNARYLARLERGVPPIDGVREVLACLAGQRPMAVVTSCNPEHFAAMHRPLDLLEHFEFTLASGQYGQHKPHPEPYLTAAARLQVDPADCVVVEDSERGLQSATRAGMHCFVVPNDLTRGSDFRKARGVLRDIRDLPDALALLEQ